SDRAPVVPAPAHLVGRASSRVSSVVSKRFVFGDTRSAEVSTLSLHDALPICVFPGGRVASLALGVSGPVFGDRGARLRRAVERRDRKRTRLNSSHVKISYAVFCMKKKRRLQQAESGRARV